jgi:hypothetical protein
MTTTSFTAPNGEPTKNPAITELGRLIDSCDEQFWNDGAGEAVIEFESDQHRSIMGIRFSKQHGFSIEQREFERQGYWGSPFITWSEKQSDVAVIVYVGGVDLKLPASSFLDPVAAKLVVADFCQTGRRSTKIRWRSTSELPESQYG